MAYKFSPHVVVFMVDKYTESSSSSLSELYYMMHQLRATSEGRIIVVLGAGEQFSKDLILWLK